MFTDNNCVESTVCVDLLVCGWTRFVMTGLSYSFHGYNTDSQMEHLTLSSFQFSSYCFSPLLKFP